MPWVDVKLYDTRVNEESVPKIIEALTQALHESSGAAVEHIQVVVQGVPAKHWGIAGKPGGQTVTTTSSTRPAARRARPPASHARGAVWCGRSSSRAKLSSSVGTGSTRRPST